MTPERESEIRRGLAWSAKAGNWTSSARRTRDLLAEIDRLRDGQASLRAAWSAQPREGMLTVYDWNGGYRGCIGVKTWERLLREGEGG